MEGILFAIIGLVVIPLLISAGKKKTQKKDDEAGTVRRPTMSDIQRAFMLMNDFDQQQDQPQSTPTPKNPAFEKPPVFAQREGFGDRVEGTSSMQGYASGLEGTTSRQGFAYGPEGTASRQGFAYGPEGTASQQGYAGAFTSPLSTPFSFDVADTDDIEEPAPVNSMAGYAMERGDEERVESSLQSRLEDRMEVRAAAPKAASVNPSPRIKLFEDRDDYVKAVIYSEVLGRGPRRGARAGVRRA